MATGSPGTNGVWQYGEDDSEATFSALLNKAASTTDTAIGLDRGRLSDLEARALSGIVPVIPTSVSVGSGSGSRNATTGLVTYTGASSVTINGVFSSTYANYKILYLNTASSGASSAIAFRFAQGGTATTSNLWNGNGYYLGTVANGNLSSPTNAVEVYQNGTVGSGFSNYSTSGEISISGNRYMNLASGFPNGAGGVIVTAMWNGSTSSFDGFRLSLSGGTTITGTLKVYGWN